MSKKLSIVTGASGFLGRHLCEKLLKEGHHVWGMDNFSTGSQKNYEELSFLDNIECFEADACDSWDETLPSIEGYELQHVFHFASPASPPLYQNIPLATMAVNSKGLQNALEYAQENNGRVIFASTSEVYGSPLEHPQKETYWGNVNPYGARSCYDESKRFGEALIYSFNQENKSNHGLVRIFNTYGPYMNPNDGRVVINFLKQIIQNDDITVYGDGKQSRSFCYVSDLIDGIYRYAETKDLSIPVNLGNPHEFTMLELAEETKKLNPKSTSKIVFQELPQDDPPVRQPDTNVAKELFKWETKVQLNEGLMKTYEWLKAEFNS